jgi:hypothetical protein
MQILQFKKINEYQLKFVYFFGINKWPQFLKGKKAHGNRKVNPS